jgi:hypothetical protein
VGFRAGLDDVEKGKLLTLPGLELQPRVHQAPSQSLYRLHYPGFHIVRGCLFNSWSRVRLIPPGIPNTSGPTPAPHDQLSKVW